MIPTPSNLSVALIGDYCKHSFNNSNSITIQALTQHLGQKSFKLYTYENKSIKINVQESSNNVIKKYFPIGNKGFMAVIYQLLTVLHAIKNADVLIFIGISGCIGLPLAQLFGKKTLVYINQPVLHYPYKRLREQVYQQVCCFFTMKYGQELIVADAAMQQLIASKYKRSSLIIHYGATEMQCKEISGSCIKKFPFVYGKFAFATLNLQDKAAALTVLETFETFSEYPIAVAAAWNSCKFGKLLFQKYAHQPGYHFIDLVTDNKYLPVLKANCFVNIHSITMGGCSLPLVDAMQNNIPSIVYNHHCNKMIAGNSTPCFENRVALSNLLYHLDANSLEQIKNNQKQIAARNYNWTDVANQFAYLITNSLTKQKSQKQANQLYRKQLLAQLKTAHLAHTKHSLS